MKKVLLGLSVTVCVFGFTGFAFAAGQGGIAGSASFQLTTGVVTSASAAVSVGKSTAYAGAATAVGTTEAFAAGASGIVTLVPSKIYIDNIAADTVLGTAQANNLTGSTTNIAAPAGTIAQTNP
ncbi:hypothetical protein VU08_03920 [Desulfobulbus sp. F5]|nr:hypothetical protein [Desulfobulbus sp. F5]